MLSQNFDEVHRSLDRKNVLLCAFLAQESEDCGFESRWKWCAIVLILVVPKTTDVATVGHHKPAVVEQTRLPSRRSKRVLQRRYTQVSEPLLFDKSLFVFVLQKQKNLAARRPDPR